MQLAMRNHVDVTAGVKEEQAIGFEANAIAFYAQISGLAKDKIGYPIREICTNAWDAARGNFEVFLPTSLNPMFRVRDYGTGMSHEDMMGRFARMYASDKRSGNTAVGGWGLGRFSPFAYLIGSKGAGAFMVTSYFGGMAKTYVLSLSETGQPMIRLMGERETDQASGLEVSFAVDRSDHLAFTEKAEQILWSFEPRPRIFPEMVFDEPVVVDSGDDWVFYRDGTVPFAHPRVRMGCVSYEIDFTQFEDVSGFFFGYGDPVMFDVPIGSLSPTLSREALAYDTRTKATISAAMASVRGIIRDRIQGVVDAQPNWIGGCRAFHDQSLRYTRLNGRGLYRSDMCWQAKPLNGMVSPTRARTMHLPVGYETAGFKHGAVHVTDVSADTVVLMQHSFSYSMQRLASAGLKDKDVLWVRCKRDDKDSVLEDLGFPDHLVLDDIKVKVTPGPKTTIRKRRVLIKEHYQLSSATVDIDMAAGGYYVSDLGRDGYMIVSDQYYRVNRSMLFSILHECIDLGILEEDVKILVKGPNEDLGENWIKIGEHLSDPLEALVDKAASRFNQGRGQYDVPDDLRGFAQTRRTMPAVVPEAITNLMNDIDVRIEAARRRAQTEMTVSDRAVSILDKLGIRIDQPVAAADDFGPLAERLRSIRRTYPLFDLITGGYGSSRREQLAHYFELTEFKDAAAYRDRDVDHVLCSGEPVGDQPRSSEF